GERFVSSNRPLGRVPRRASIFWSASVTVIPHDTDDISYDQAAQQLHISDGTIDGVRPDVRDFAVSGMNVLDRWLGARTRKGIGLAATKKAKPLDRIRPTEWEDEWNDELLDLLRVLTETLDLASEQQVLLNQIT